jgi:hypothetical protein
MGAVQEATVTVPEAARRLGRPVEDVLDLIYSRMLPATAERASGRLLIRPEDLDRIASTDEDHGDAS